MNAVIPPVEKRAWHYKQEKVKNVRNAHMRNGAMKLLAIVLPLIAIGLFVADRLGRSDLFLIDEIEYRGVFAYADQTEVDSITKSALKGNFFTVDLLAVQRSLLAMPWVETVHLGREWPNKIIIIIDEYEPMMRWVNDGLVMKKGELVKSSIDSFANATELRALPVLDGRENSLPEMMMRYTAWRIDLNSMGMNIEKIALTESSAWTISLKNVDGEVFDLRLGSINPDARFNRFVRLFSQGESYFKGLEYVDARYPNGVVVKRKLKEESEPIEEKQSEGEADA